MTSNSNGKKRRSVRGDYGFARVRDQAFEAVVGLWRQRKAEGMKQRDIADVLNASEGWVSRQFRGPGNWTLRTIGELVEALEGEIEIYAFRKEDPPSDRTNYDAYSGYGRPSETALVIQPSGEAAWSHRKFLEQRQGNSLAGAGENAVKFENA